MPRTRPPGPTRCCWRSSTTCSCRSPSRWAPGSMPASSRDLHEEGVLFDNWLLVSDGRFREEETLGLLTGARYPSRNPATNLADLRAQIAANARGVEEVGRMIAHFGLDVVQA